MSSLKILSNRSLIFERHLDCLPIIIFDPGHRHHFSVGHGQPDRSRIIPRQFRCQIPGSAVLRRMQHDGPYEFPEDGAGLIDLALRHDGEIVPFIVLQTPPNLKTLLAASYKEHILLITLLSAASRRPDRRQLKGKAFAMSYSVYPSKSTKHTCVFGMERKGNLFTGEVVCAACGVYLSSLDPVSPRDKSIKP